mgnify:CR=1 FL=1
MAEPVRKVTERRRPRWLELLVSQGRLAEAGFSVTIDHFFDTISPEERKRFGLHPEALYICRKAPAAG